MTDNQLSWHAQVDRVKTSFSKKFCALRGMSYLPKVCEQISRHNYRQEKRNTSRIENYKLPNKNNTFQCRWLTDGNWKYKT